MHVCYVKLDKKGEFSQSKENETKIASEGVKKRESKFFYSGMEQSILPTVNESIRMGNLSWSDKKFKERNNIYPKLMIYFHVISTQKISSWSIFPKYYFY